MKNLNYIIKKVLLETHDEQHSSRYMFFSNLEQMRRQCDLLLDLDQNMIEEILENGHDWAQDHISEAKNNMDQVFDFLMNETNAEFDSEIRIKRGDVMMEGRKKKNVATNKKLWQQALAWAKQRYEVCPSAYCNGAAVKHYNSKGGRWKKG